MQNVKNMEVFFFMKKVDWLYGSDRSSSLVMAVGVAAVVVMVITVSAVPAVGSEVNGVKNEKIKINKSEIVNIDGVDIACYYPTYEEFLSYNDTYYKFLQEELGEKVADGMMKARYEEVTTEREGIQGKGLRYWLQTVTHDGMSIEFLPYIWGSKNVDTNETGIINAVFVNADQSDVINRLESEGWECGEGCGTSGALMTVIGMPVILLLIKYKKEISILQGIMCSYSRITVAMILYLGVGIMNLGKGFQFSNIG